METKLRSIFLYDYGSISIFVYTRCPLAAIIVVPSFASVGFIFPNLAAPFSLRTNPLMLNFCAGMIVALAYYKNMCIPKSLLSTVGILATALLFLPSAFMHTTNEVPRLLFLTPGMILWIAFFTLRSSPYIITFGEVKIRSFAARTYTLYFFHIILLKLAEKIYFKLAPSLSSTYIYVVVGAVLSVISVYILFPLIEEPLGRFLRAIFLRREERLAPS